MICLRPLLWLLPHLGAPRQLCNESETFLLLQLRLLDGTCSVKSFRAADTLQDVANQIGSDNTRLMTNFPNESLRMKILGKVCKN